MTFPHFNRRPEGYLVMIDGRVVDDAGKNGVIKNALVARSLGGILQASRPDADVTVMAVITDGKRP